MAAEETMQEAKFDIENLYREDTFTDLKVGRLKRLTPVNPDGTTDKARQVKFLGQTQIMSNAGPIPISCEIEAKDLKQAIKKFPEAVQAAVVDLMEEVKEMQRQEAGRIVVPGVETQKKILMPK